MRIKNKQELIFPELSYKIVGCLYEVYNQLKYGHREKVYQKAIAEQLETQKIIFKKEQYYPVTFNNKIISRYFVDFLVDDKIALEIKIAEDFYQKDINQLLSYLKFKGIKLGILVLFSKDGIKCRRILN